MGHFFQQGWSRASCRVPKPQLFWNPHIWPNLKSQGAPTPQSSLLLHKSTGKLYCDDATYTVTSESVFQPCLSCYFKKRKCIPCFVLSVTAEALWFSDHEGNQGVKVLTACQSVMWWLVTAPLCSHMALPPLLASFVIAKVTTVIPSTAPRAFTPIGVASLATLGCNWILTPLHTGLLESHFPLSITFKVKDIIKLILEIPHQMSRGYILYTFFNTQKSSRGNNSAGRRGSHTVNGVHALFSKLQNRCLNTTSWIQVAICFGHCWFPDNSC